MGPGVRRATRNGADVFAAAPDGSVLEPESLGPQAVITANAMWKSAVRRRRYAGLNELNVVTTSACKIVDNDVDCRQIIDAKRARRFWYAGKDGADHVNPPPSVEVASSCSEDQLEQALKIVGAVVRDADDPSFVPE